MFGTVPRMTEFFQLMPSGLGVGMCSAVRLRNMVQFRVQCKADLPLPQATARNPADKVKRDFTFIGDARLDGRIGMTKVARVTN